MASSGRVTQTGGREATGGNISGDCAIAVGMPDTAPPDGWRWQKLTDLARLETGHTPSRRHPEWWDGDIPWIGIKDATGNHGRTIDDTLQHTNQDGIDNSSARVLPANTVCLSRTASVGYVVVMGRPMATSQDFVNWVCSPDLLDHQFLKYALLAERGSFLRFAHGTTHQTIYFPEVKGFHLCAPSLPEQKAIAGVLGALDDKIELNRRMNETLEGIARAIFKSWFIDFDPVLRNARAAGNPIPPELASRTPSEVEGDKAALSSDALAKEDALADSDNETGTVLRSLDAAGPVLHSFSDAAFPDRFQDSPLGPIPDGWEATQLGEVIQILDKKRIPLSGRERAKRQGKYRYYGAAGILDHVDDFLFDGVHVLVGEDGSVIDDSDHPVVQYVWGRFWVNNHAHVLLGKNGVSNEHLLLALRETHIRPFITGAVQPKLNQRNMKQVPFILPSAKVCSAFSEAIQPLFAQVRANHDQSRTLAALRDTLLPKLLSGQVRVPEQILTRDRTPV